MPDFVETNVLMFTLLCMPMKEDEKGGAVRSHSARENLLPDVFCTPSETRDTGAGLCSIYQGSVLIGTYTDSSEGGESALRNFTSKTEEPS